MSRMHVDVYLIMSLKKANKKKRKLYETIKKKNPFLQRCSGVNVIIKKSI